MLKPNLLSLVQVRFSDIKPCSYIMSCRILIQCEGFENSILDLEPGVYTLGSAPDNSIQLPLPGVEEFHGELEITEDDRVLVRDAGSMSGMMINGEPITESVLTSSHPLCLGEAMISYQPSAASAPDAPSPAQSYLQTEETDEPATWWAALPGALAYPIISTLVVAFIFIGIFLNLPFGFGIFGFIARVILFGSLVFIMMNTVSSAAGGESAYSLGNFVEFSLSDSYEALLQYIGLILVCMGPMILIDIGYEGDETQRAMLILLAFALGSLYLPIPFLALSLTGSLSVLNPVFVIKSFMRIPGPAILMAFLLMVINTGDAILMRMYVEVDGFGSGFITGSLVSIIYYCLLNAWCRALGLMYHYYQRRLNWV